MFGRFYNSCVFCCNSGNQGANSQLQWKILGCNDQVNVFGFVLYLRGIVEEWQGCFYRVLVYLFFKMLGCMFDFGSNGVDFGQVSFSSWFFEIGVYSIMDGLLLFQNGGFEFLEFLDVFIGGSLGYCKLMGMLFFE